MAAIHADAAFAAGGTGQGITVAVIDTGVDPTQADLQGAVSSDSTDLFSSRNKPSGEDQHATFVAGIVGSRFNGMGTIGVAYDSTILSIRADDPGSCASTSTSDKNSCTFNDDVIARGIDYARTHGAKVINLSLGGDGSSGPLFEAALSRAVAAGIAVTISAGNDSKADPDWPAQYAVDTRYAGLVVAVGATDENNALASYSNKAGVAADGYVVAPGDNLITNCSAAKCWEVSGTSFSSPAVAGAVALMLQAFPTLTARDAVRILLQSTDDLGDPGVDAVYGQGLIDLQRAFQPVGSMSVMTSATTSVQAVSMLGSSLGPAFGDAFQRTGALSTVAFDSYRRMFKVNMAEGFPARRAGLVGGGVGPDMEEAQAVLQPAKGVRLSLAAGSAAPGLEPPSTVARFRDERLRRSDLNLRLDAGRFSFQAWQGRGGMPAAPDLAAASNAFAAVAGPVQAMRAAYRLKGVALAVETGQGRRTSEFGHSELAPSHYALFSAGVARRRWAAEISAGRLVEPQGPLGSLLPAGSTFSLPAATDFASARADWAAGERLVLSASAGVGRTRVETSSILTQTTPAISTTWRLTARTRCLDARAHCTSFEADIEQPLRIESGGFSALLPDAPARYGDPLNFSRRRFSAAPSGRELDLRLGVDRGVRGAGLFQLQLVGAREPGNVASAPVGLGVIAGWRARF